MLPTLMTIKSQGNINHVQNTDQAQLDDFNIAKELPLCNK